MRSAGDGRTFTTSSGFVTAAATSEAPDAAAKRSGSDTPDAALDMAQHRTGARLSSQLCRRYA